MKYKTRLAIMTVFFIVEILWGLTLFVVGWANADGGNKMGFFESILPSFYPYAYEKIGLGMFSHLYSLISVFNFGSLFIALMAFPFLIYKSKKRKPLTEEQLKQTRKAQKEQQGIVFKSAVIAIFCLWVIYVIWMDVLYY